MIPYCPSRARNSARYHARMIHAVECQTGMCHTREANRREDYRAIDHWFNTHITAQFKVQTSPAYETWTVQCGMWHYAVDWYVFAHPRTQRIYIIPGHALHGLERLRYDGPKTNQPFYYGPLSDIADHPEGIVTDMNGVLICDDLEDMA